MTIRHSVWAQVWAKGAKGVEWALAQTPDTRMTPKSVIPPPEGGMGLGGFRREPG